MLYNDIMKYANDFVNEEIPYREPILFFTSWHIYLGLKQYPGKSYTIFDNVNGHVYFGGIKVLDYKTQKHAISFNYINNKRKMHHLPLLRLRLERSVRRINAKKY